MRKFGLTLSDGSTVDVEFEYVVPTMPHFSYRGECISSTGYRSHFIGTGKIEESEIESIALECAENIRAEYLKELNKKKRGKKS